MQALLSIHQSQFYCFDEAKMGISCEAKVRITLFLGVLILVVLGAVITVVVLKSTTDDLDDPDLSSNLEFNDTMVENASLAF